MMTTGRKIRVFHLTWSGDLAGMLWDIIRTQHRDPELELHVAFGTRGKGVFFDQIRSLGIETFSLGMKKKYSPLCNLAGAWRLRRILQNNHYDIIHLQEAILPFPFWSASASGPGTAVILHNRGEFNFTRGWGAALGQGMKKWIYRLIVGKRIDRLVCNSRYSAGQTPLSKKMGRKFVVLHNAIDMAKMTTIARDKDRLRGALRAELELREEDCVFAVVARLVQFKRIERFIRAFALALQEGTRVWAVIAGDGPDRENLETLTRQLGCSGHIRFLGFRKDAKEIVAGSDLFVLPSSGEAFGNAALEALSLGTPTVVFRDAGGPMEFIEEGKNGFVVADEAALTHTLTMFAKDGQMRQMFREQPLIDKNHYAIESYVERIKTLYDDVLSDCT